MIEVGVERMPMRFRRLPAVMEITGLSRSSIYSRIHEGRFPIPVSLGGRAVGWIEAEILQWVQDRVSEARSKPTHQQLAQAA
jgi:prophage regulatory protein